MRDRFGTQIADKIPGDKLWIKSVYLAGKITNNSWRDEIVSYRDGDWSGENHGAGASSNSGDWNTVPEALPTPNGAKLAFTGPFWRPFSGWGGHGNFDQHAKGLHANGDVNPYNHSFDMVESDPQFIAGNVELAIHECDLFFAWIDSLDAIGTLVEIGLARSLRKRVVVATSLEDVRELWLPLTFADVTIMASSPKEAWWKLWKEKPRKVSEPIVEYVPHPVSDEEEPEMQYPNEDDYCSLEMSDLI